MQTIAGVMHDTSSKARTQNWRNVFNRTSGYLNPWTQYHFARPSRRRQYKHLCVHFVYTSDSVDFGGSLPEFALSITDGQKLHRHPSVVAVLL
jgi:hypothetical protein